MIGIVVVSHSRALAQAVVDLAAEMVEGEQSPQVAVAAGLDDQTFGTDASAVAEAIEAVDSPDGVLVLVDLGSAVLSADMAREFLDPAVAERVRVSSAPLVEGLVAAVVTAAGGADLNRVHREAGQALAAKVGQVGDADSLPEDGAGSGHTDEGSADREGTGRDLGPDALSREVRVDIPHGLHARPAARVVGCVNRFPEAEVVVRTADGESAWVSASSLSAVATLNAHQGQRLQLRARGDDAAAVLDALEELAGEGFGDAGEQESCQGGGDADSTTRPLLPMGSGLDLALGPVRRGEEILDPADYTASGDAETERERLVSALDRAVSELRELAATTRAGVGAQQAGIFAAHEAWARDPGITGPAFADIAKGEPAATSWVAAGRAAEERFAAVDDAYLRERAEDVRSVTNRVLRLLVGASADADSDAGRDRADEEEGYILLVTELDPATAVAVDASRVSGIVTTGGGSTGHGVLLAQARGIPTITGRSETATVRSGTWLAFDTRARRLWVDPGASVRAAIEGLRARRVKEQVEERAAAGEPGHTRDGRLVQVLANVAGTQEALRAVELGAQGSGLVRTEVLFESWSALPTVQEQASELANVARALDGRRMTVRTWDVGADKPLGFWTQEAELNPFLGVRGIRSFAADSTLLGDQLRAVCRVARDYPVRVMFPMVTTVSEVRWAVNLLDAAAEQEGGSRPNGLEVGIMVEVPAAAIQIAYMAAELDFVSIGTNDLTQYTMAAERGHPGVEHLVDPVDPAVLRLIQGVCADVPDRVEVAVCGGAASDPAAACLLVGLGVDELSSTPVAVPRVKAMLRRHSTSELGELAGRALSCSGASEVRELLGGLDPSPVNERREYGTGC